MSEQSTRQTILSLAIMTLISLAVIPSITNTLVVSAQDASTNNEIKSDFNGDGYEDLAIGIPFETLNGIPGAGAVSVLYGSDTGLQASSPADQFWTQESPGVEDSLDKSDNFGNALAPCDFNGDGFSDLAIGQRFEAFSRGAVNVIYGSSLGLRTNVAGDGTGQTDQFWTQDSPGVEDTAEVDDLFGSSLAVGDLDGDAYCDLAIGVISEVVDGKDTAGAVNILYGSASGITSSGDQFWHQNSAGIESSAVVGELFASSLTVGDYDNDGYDDLAIGVPGERIDGVNGAGAVHVLYGSSSGIQTSSPSDQFWNQNSPGMDDQADGQDAFGQAMASGDLNGDGFEDLAIAVGGEGASANENSGAVNVLYGSNSGLQTSSPVAQFWHQESPGVNDDSGSFDGFGSSLTIADFNDDSYGDLGIGVFNDNIGSEFGAGAVSVIYGSSSGLRTSAAGDDTGRSDQFWHQDSTGIDDSAESGDSFGSSLAAGDFNFDGFDDLAVGIPREDVGSVGDAGAVSIIFGSSVGLVRTEDQFWHQNSSNVNDGAENDDTFGRALA